MCCWFRGTVVQSQSGVESWLSGQGDSVQNQKGYKRICEGNMFHISSSMHYVEGYILQSIFNVLSYLAIGSLYMTHEKEVPMKNVNATGIETKTLVIWIVSKVAIYSIIDIGCLLVFSSLASLYMTHQNKVPV